MKKFKIDPDILIAELAELYPEVINFLIYEYQFHCFGCFVSQFETLRQGASVHGIVGKYFEEMLAKVTELIEKIDREKLQVINKSGEKLKTLKQN